MCHARNLPWSQGRFHTDISQHAVRVIANSNSRNIVSQYAGNSQENLLFDSIIADASLSGLTPMANSQVAFESRQAKLGKGEFKMSG